ncbi:hypothetical protein EXIGLDRAFT_764811 [Exidia glandulosa HHB12029]|uniref:Uncharacterized protein n=1 Tax=Exidia glandulosa HHB12029 TaxID=1314781 RepID=A0A165KXS1_EXIGL|nr:hypothetical protein EXIGLDRAFT_764811 [Exidia glandulosa HHB12029]
MARPTASPSPSTTTRIPYLHALSMCLAAPARPVGTRPLPTRPVRAVLELVGATQQRYRTRRRRLALVAAEDDEQQHGHPFIHPSRRILDLSPWARMSQAPRTFALWTSCSRATSMLSPDSLDVARCALALRHARAFVSIDPFVPALSGPISLLGTARAG